MGLLRSELMKYGMLLLPAEEARKVVYLLGKDTAIQLEDMNAHEMRRPYRKYVQRIDEMERMLRFLFDEIVQKEGVQLQTNRLTQFIENDAKYNLDEVEVEIAKVYNRFKTFQENNARLIQESNTAMEECEVVQTAVNMLIDDTSSLTESFEESATKGLLEVETSRRLGQIAGVVLRSEQLRLATAISRATRGNAYIKLENISKSIIDPKTGMDVQKAVFVVYFQQSLGASEKDSAMHAKIMKVCAAFGVNLYAWPTSKSEADQRLTSIQKTIEDKATAVEAFRKFKKIETDEMVALPDPKANSRLEEWRLFCVKEKSIYAQLNLCQGEALLRVNCWYPADDEAKIQALLRQQNSGSTIPSQGAMLMPDRKKSQNSPPTYIRMNEYTQGWQDVINTYGIPRYQEFNPAVFTYVTFPFIFGMMYGDVGHGFLLFLAGVFMCAKSESLRYTVPAAFTARFMVLQMGMCATFAGFMYNDFFSVGMQIWPSKFEDPNGDGNFVPTYDVTNSGGEGPYPFGLDPAWIGASNELLFVNSLKMKMSVLFGVLQMIVGVLVRWSNALYEKNMVDFICECLPMMVFMICFFGWMDFLILYKWTHPVDNAPNIINSMICMGMGQQDNMPMFDGSVELSKKLMLATVLSVPCMLIPKPICLIMQNSAKNSDEHELLTDEETGGGGHGGHGEEFDVGEMVIHQVIETIEYVLGTVSHTASYLRIWALSLAHQQLSLVFFQKTITGALISGNAFALYFGFLTWFGITCGVLLGMDVLECFLHTLRLHWVEFQSKFYKADGYLFEPYSIKKLLEPIQD
eukprot:gnl/TRDRNA2_/TRDRNA2_39575_c0_seq1.p1 gnl/TRDRNA2_/TRDRNA2_39575_c0~~gnl/TRDRNA2_/TRDRNA2_39575_c0_seq1.p1  ORF type:complete len:804 (-),score=201.51 gnl/TRDRNA2_/TRDRNA2_39575_c0_seq1:200-2611(-)